MNVTVPELKLCRGFSQDMVLQTTVSVIYKNEGDLRPNDQHDMEPSRQRAYSLWQKPIP